MNTTPPPLPRILILLTTHNGAEFVAAQLDSVLAQEGVEVEVVISDDASADATPEVLDGYRGDARVRRLEPGRFGSAAANFSRLVRECPGEGFDAVAFCDQDDIWVPWKLRRHYELLISPRGVDGGGPYAAVSSNVEAFDPDGRRRLIMKNQPQRECDYAFESGGPGSTFLMRPETYDLVRERLLDPDSAAASVRSHDWLVYALVRASGRRWFIDGEPTVEYRQHDRNELGANEGWRSHLGRIRAVADGRYREDVRRVVTAAAEVAADDQAERLAWIARIAERPTPLARLRLARMAPRLRRRRRDQLALAAMVAAGLW